MALLEYGPLSNEVLIADRAEARARQKWLAHSVGCMAASNELMELLARERLKRLPPVRKLNLSV